MTNNTDTQTTSLIARIEEEIHFTYGYAWTDAREAVTAYAAAIALGHTQDSAVEVMQAHSPVSRGQFLGAIERAAL